VRELPFHFDTIYEEVITPCPYNGKGNVGSVSCSKCVSNVGFLKNKDSIYCKADENHFKQMYSILKNKNKKYFQPKKLLIIEKSLLE
jgi:hypothetical protein